MQAMAMRMSAAMMAMRMVGTRMMMNTPCRFMAMHSPSAFMRMMARGTFVVMHGMAGMMVADFCHGSTLLLCGTTSDDIFQHQQARRQEDRR